MRNLSKFFSVALFIVFSLSFFNANAETRAYKYLFSVKDDVKQQGIFRSGQVWYITFTPDRSKCYLSNAQGVSASSIYADYIGSKNGMLIYKEVTPFLGTSYYYFSPDFSRLNWHCISDNLNNYGSPLIRVLEYEPDPHSVDVPSHLY